MKGGLLGISKLLDLMCGIDLEGLAFGMCGLIEMTFCLFILFGLTNDYAISCGNQCKTMVGRLRMAFLNVKAFMVTRRLSSMSLINYGVLQH